MYTSVEKQLNTLIFDFVAISDSSLFAKYKWIPEELHKNLGSCTQALSTKTNNAVGPQSSFCLSSFLRNAVPPPILRPPPQLHCSI